MQKIFPLSAAARAFLHFQKAGFRQPLGIHGGRFKLVGVIGGQDVIKAAGKNRPKDLRLGGVQCALPDRVGEFLLHRIVHVIARHDDRLERCRTVDLAGPAGEILSCVDAVKEFRPALAAECLQNSTPNQPVCSVLLSRTLRYPLLLDFPVSTINGAAPVGCIPIERF